MDVFGGYAVLFEHGGHVEHHLRIATDKSGPGGQIFDRSGNNLRDQTLSPRPIFRWFREDGCEVEVGMLLGKLGKFIGHEEIVFVTVAEEEMDWVGWGSLAQNLLDLCPDGGDAAAGRDEEQRTVNSFWHREPAVRRQQADRLANFQRFGVLRTHAIRRDVDDEIEHLFAGQRRKRERTAVFTDQPAAVLPGRKGERRIGFELDEENLGRELLFGDGRSRVFFRDSDWHAGSVASFLPQAKTPPGVLYYTRRMPANAKRVVIIGGGYAGVRAAHDLAKASRHDALEIILVSDSPYHVEIPSLYEVATSFIGHESVHSSEIACQGVMVPLEDIFEKLPVVVKHGGVTEIEPQDRLVVMQDHSTLSYDYLVLALGAKTATYNIPGVQEHAFGIKTLPEALRLRHHIIRLLMTETAPTFIVVGGGATGVEVIAELAGLIRHVQHAHHVTKRLKLILIEASPAILRDVPQETRDAIMYRLQQLGVTIMVNEPVARIESSGVALASGQHVGSHAVIWAGGLQAHEVVMRSHLPLKGWGVQVEKTLQVAGHPTIFAAGDSAVIDDAAMHVPATVPVAYTQGSLIARNIMHLIAQQPLEPYRYDAPGQLITLGGKRALYMSTNKRTMIGLAPWIARQFVTLQYWLRYLAPWTALHVWYQGIWQQSRND